MYLFCLPTAALAKLNSADADADADVNKGKVAIELTTNVPSDNVDITAIIKVISEQDRGVVAAK